jgi:hypothetical protein
LAANPHGELVMEKEIVDATKVQFPVISPEDYEQCIVAVEHNEDEVFRVTDEKLDGNLMVEIRGFMAENKVFVIEFETLLKLLHGARNKMLDRG